MDTEKESKNSQTPRMTACRCKGMRDTTLVIFQILPTRPPSLATWATIGQTYYSILLEENESSTVVALEMSEQC